MSVNRANVARTAGSGRRLPPRRPRRARAARRSPATWAAARPPWCGHPLSPPPPPRSQSARRSPSSEIYARAAPGVVQITSTDTAVQDTPSLSPGFDLPQAPSQQALGSGFVIDKAGHIVTNYHVIEGADQIEVSFSNQDTLRATLVGSDPVHRHRRAPGRGELAQPDAARARRLGRGPRRRPGRRDRQPVRARAHRDRRHRQRRPGAHDHGAERLSDRPRDPDRRSDQPRQLGRPAAERPRRGDRRQLADRAGAGLVRQRRHRLRRPVEHGQGGRRPARRDRQGRSRVPRHRRRHRHRRARARLPAPGRRGRARRGRRRRHRGRTRRA